VKRGHCRVMLKCGWSGVCHRAFDLPGTKLKGASGSALWIVCLLFLPACQTASEAPLPSAKGDAPAAVAAVTASQAETPPALSSMASVVRKGLANSPEVNKSQTDRLVSGLSVGVARDAFWPTLSGSIGADTHSEGNYDLRLTQPIFDFGARAAGLRGARAQQRATDREAFGTHEDVALNSAKAYITVKRYEALVKVADDNIAAHRRFLDLADTRLGGGVADRAEVDLAEVRLATARATKADFEGQLASARSLYTLLIGEPPNGLDEPGMLSLQTSELVDIDVFAERSPRVEQAIAEIAVADNQIGVERAALLPELQGEAVLAGDHDDSPTPYIGVRLVGPTFTGASQFRNVEIARAQKLAAEYEAQAVRREVKDTLSRFVDNDGALADEIRILKGQISRAQSLRKVYEDQFVLGTRSLTDLISVQNDIFGIAQTLVQNRYDRMAIQYEATAAIGRLQQELGLPSSLLDLSHTGGANPIVFVDEEEEPKT